METFGGKGKGQRAQESCAGRKITPSKVNRARSSRGNRRERDIW